MMFKRSSVETRPAHACTKDCPPGCIDEVALVQADLAKDKRWEQVDLKKGILCVTLVDGEIRMYGQARMVWQIEPVKWLRGARGKCSAHQQKKATYLTIRWLDGWLADVRNNPYIRGYFCVISNANRVMKKLAIAFGMQQVYPKCEFFGRDL